MHAFLACDSSFVSCSSLPSPTPLIHFIPQARSQLRSEEGKLAKQHYEIMLEINSAVLIHCRSQALPACVGVDREIRVRILLPTALSIPKCSWTGCGILCRSLSTHPSDDRMHLKNKGWVEQGRKIFDTENQSLVWFHCCREYIAENKLSPDKVS